MVWRRVEGSDRDFMLVGSSGTISANVEGAHHLSAADFATVKVEQGDLLAIHWPDDNPIPYTLEDPCTDDTTIYYIQNPSDFTVGNTYSTQTLPDCRTYSVQVEIQTSKMFNSSIIYNCIY